MGALALVRSKLLRGQHSMNNDVKENSIKLRKNICSRFSFDIYAINGFIVNAVKYM